MLSEDSFENQLFIVDKNGNLTDISSKGDAHAVLKGRNIFNRDINVKWETPDNYYITLTTKQFKIYIISNDFKLHLFKISYDFFSLQLKQIDTIDLHIYYPDFDLKTNYIKIVSSYDTLGDINDHIFIISNNFIISFKSVEGNFSEYNFQVLMSEPQFKQRKNISSVLLAENSLFIASGSDGLDIYYHNSSNGDVKYLQTLDAKQFGLEEVEIKDVKLNSDALFILDKSGVYIFKLLFRNEELINAELQDFSIPVQNGFLLNQVEGRTILVAVQQPVSHNQSEFFEFSQINYVFLEFLVQYKGKNKFFYLNKVLPSMGKIYQIHVTPDIAIVIGEQNQEIIFHSVFQGFLQSFGEYGRNIQESGLKELELLTPVIDQKLLSQKQEYQQFYFHRYMIGLNKNGLRLLQIEIRPAQIYFVSSDDQQIPTGTYLIKSNTSSCLNGYEDELFTMCQTQQEIELEIVFKLESGQIALGRKEKFLFGLIVVIVVIVFLFLAACILFIKKKYKEQIRVVEKELNKLKYQKIIEEKDQGADNESKQTGKKLEIQINQENIQIDKQQQQYILQQQDQILNKNNYNEEKAQQDEQGNFPEKSEQNLDQNSKDKKSEPNVSNSYGEFQIDDEEDSQK